MPTRTLRALLACSVCFAIPTAATAASVSLRPDAVDESIPTQLPRVAIPHHYAITVTPHAQQLTFDGRVAIDLDVVQPIRTLTLNAAELSFAKATLSGKGAAPVAAQIATDSDAQTVTFTFPRQLARGAYRLTIDYSGKIHTQANGLFALDYTDKAGRPARAIYTQFEPADARRFVPSWDEPDYKASWSLAARVPQSQMAVSNTPAAASQPIGGGLKEVRFQTTPAMSSYLLFFGTGDFDRITKPSAGREVGVVTSRGNSAGAQAALDDEAEILPYYNSYFGTPFPLPKLDNVAGPGQSQFFSAMENWGAIFTFERSLLLDPAISTEADRQRVFGTEAHEMAHQWFGDLVTMAWWNDLWLNEGFASWMATKSTEHFHPDWGADVGQIGAREAAMAQDSFVTTHPVVQNVRTVEQANQAFDSITYSKGESVISMLESFATPPVWQKGIQLYIRAHAYHNSVTDDLWAAMESAGATGLTTVAHDFTKQPGIPLIIAGPAQCLNGNSVVSITQSQFSMDQREQTAANPLLWHVPLRASAGGAPVQIVTEGHTAKLQVPGCGPLLINPGQTGYYRTLYTPDEAQALVRAFPALHTVDQYGLIGGWSALSTAGYQPVARILDLLSVVPANSSQQVVEIAAGRWAALYELFDKDPATQAAIASRVIKMFGPRLQALGFAPRPGEPALDAVLRPALIQTLGRMRDPAVQAQANAMFAAWLKDRNAIPGSLKETWLGIAAQNASPQTWDAIHAAAKAATNPIERTALYQMLGQASDDSLARQALQLALTDEPGKTTSAGIINRVAARHPDMALDFVLANLPKVTQLVDLSAQSRFIARVAGGSDDPATIGKLRAYADANLKPTDRRPIDQAIAVIEWRTRNDARIKTEVTQWLQQHPA